jgi:hypothetical protein
VMWGAARPATIPAATSRLVSFISFLLEAGLHCRPFLVLASARADAKTRVLFKDSLGESKFPSRDFGAWRRCVVNYGRAQKVLTPAQWP